MRMVGNTHIALPSLMPSAAALQQAAVHQTTAMALMHVASSGVRKGVYRFATHEAANRASDEALSRAIAMNLERMTREKDKMDRLILERALAASKGQSA